jgi:hypothetical protein
VPLPAQDPAIEAGAASATVSNPHVTSDDSKMIIRMELSSAVPI